MSGRACEWGGPIEVVKGPEFEINATYHVTVDSAVIGMVERRPSWSGRSATFQPLSPLRMRLGRPCATRREAVVQVLLAAERRARR